MGETRKNKNDNIDILDGDFSKLDKDNMIELLEEFPQKMRDALRLGEEFSIPTNFSPTSASSSFSAPDSTTRNFKNIVVLGMGGSAIGGDLLSDYLADELSIPIVVIRGYDIPKFVDENSLVFSVSYSGNTEETISALKKCLEAKARIIALTSGGKLAVLSQENNFPVIKVPAGIQPRAAISYLFFPILKALERLGLIKERSSEIEETISILQDLSREYCAKSPSENNLAKKVALSLYQHLPLVYGSEGLLGAVAMRWKTQINENSKWPCFWNVFPELDHNEIVGYEIENKINRQVKIIYLQDKEGLLRVEQRRKITRKIIEDKVAEFIVCPTKGKGKMSRMFSLIFLGDLASYYLAILNQVDPSPVACIEDLKKELAK
ncbi:bifunctional phosphoglucose/phosphomannose isomerase [bacterium]|nr:bifunctional phosphoglucose/phosphomannose isomerase [bacterium]MBU1427575.1 bifunctional phosphoglucose/phosphomannose isomerase [bacterium]MBU2439492.1 bifunctional phosphoglucose/phosphomannose isomerase [bacterium]